MLEPLQDAMLELAQLEATLEGGKKAKAMTTLENLRKTDKMMRDRLCVLQVRENRVISQYHNV